RLSTTGVRWSRARVRASCVPARAPSGVDCHARVALGHLALPRETRKFDRRLFEECGTTLASHPWTSAAPTIRRWEAEVQALRYHGTRDVRVEEVADPRIEADDDIVLRVTATAICGSDLHLSRGKVPALQDGDILGHEFMGIVEETGRSVASLRRGDRVVVPLALSGGERLS